MADYAIHDTTLEAIADTIRKKDGTSALIDPADYADRINLMGMLEEKTVSGSIAHITDGADEVPIKSWEVEIAPTLTGKSAIEATVTGKNLLNYADITTSYRITSLTDNGDGSFTVVASGLGAYIDHIIPVKAGQAYSIKCTSATNDEGNASQIGVVNVYDGSDDTATLLLNGASISTRKGFTPTGNYILVRNKVTGGSGSGTGTIVKPQLELGSTATTYEPYVTPTQYTASLGRTIYGGTADVVKGEGQETHGKVVFDGMEGTGGTPSWTMISVTQGTMFRITASDKVTTSATNTLCSYYTPVAQAQRADGTVSGAGTNVDIIDNRFSSVDAFKAWLAENPVTLVYELSTPTDFTFDGQEVNTRLGYNAFWSDEGDTEVTYRASGTMTPIMPTLISKTITENGTYSAEDDDADGYDEVVVNVPSQEVNVTPIGSTRTYLYPDDISGTNVERTAQTLTATGTGKYVFASDTATRTNTSSNDGFVGVKKNGTFVVKQNLNTDVKVSYTIPDIDVVAGDEVSIVVGFANYHTSCYFEIYTAIAFVEEVTS